MAKSTKKQNGEGTIYFDEKSGSWRGELSWVDKKGKLQRKSWKSKKQTTIKAKMGDFKRQLLLDEGKVNPDVTTFQEYAEHWLIKKLKSQLKPSSYDRKENTLYRQVFPLIGEIPISMITSSDIESMMTTLSEQGLSYSSIKKAYEAVNGCFKAYRVDTRTNLFNPCEGVKIPIETKREVSEIVFFDKEQRKLIENEATKKFSNGAPVYKLGQAIVLLMYSGMRIGELIALTWEDVDFDERTININKNAIIAKQGGDSYQMINQKSTKTKSGFRVIPMTAKAYEALKEQQVLTGEEKHVLSTRNHKQVMHNNVNRTFHRVLKAVGIMSDDSEDSYGVHTLRHTFASMLFQNGCDIKVVSELLGHADTKITENIYLHVIHAQKVKAIQDIDKFSD